MVPPPATPYTPIQLKIIIYPDLIYIYVKHYIAYSPIPYIPTNTDENLPGFQAEGQLHNRQPPSGHIQVQHAM